MRDQSTPQKTPTTSPPQPRAFVYCRVSSAMQEDGASLDEQERICREYDDAQGYAVAGVFREVEDGEEVERPVLSRLLAAGKRGEGDAVLVWKQDRLGRGSAIHVVLWLLDGAGIEPLCVTEPFSEGIISTTVRGIVSGEEKKNIRLRTQGGRKARAASGRLIPGPCPAYGYRWRDDKKTAYDIDETTAPVVRRIYREIAAGKKLREVAAGLKADGVPTPNGGREWSNTTLRKYALNPFYIGRASAYATRKIEKVRVNGKRVQRFVERPEDEIIPLPEGTVPPLVTPELARIVREQLARNKRESPRRNANPEAFLLRAGFVRCGCCGKAAATRWQGGRTPDSPRFPQYFVQRQAWNHADCAGASISAAKLDAEVWSFVETILDRPEHIFRRLEQLREEDTTKDELAAIDKALAAVAKQHNSWMLMAAAVEDADAAAEIAAKLAALGRERKEYEGRRANVLARRRGWEARQEQLRELAAWIARTRRKLDYFDTPALAPDEVADLRAAGVEYSDEQAAWLTTPPGAWAGDTDIALLEVTQDAYRMERERNPPSYKKKREWLTALGLEVSLFPADHQPRYTIRTDLSSAIVDTSIR